MREVAARAKSLGEELSAVEAELERDARAAAEPARPRRAARGHGAARGGGPARAGRDHLELAGDDDRHGARGAAVRLALRLPARRPRLLELALVRWALEKLRGHGFEPVIPPVLVREEALYGTGFLPDTEQQIYRCPTTTCTSSARARSRSPRCTPARSSTPSELPLRYAGFSPCFRREAGAAGRDTRGIFRVHQFDKVEMFSFVEPAPRRTSTSACSRSRRRS